VLQDSPLGYSGLWGDDEWAVNLVAITVGAVVLAVGLIGLGRWLRSEHAAVVDGPGGALTA